ncbi:cytidylyltransferase family protein [Geopyxis carbonaria]|nr:cytidylyltransferase family protein [Geopyxis carbonaria]
MPASADMQRILPSLRSTVASFATSCNNIHIFPRSPQPVQPGPLYILDSSFNPPTLAHASLVLSCKPKNLLLLLAVQNADKAPAPAEFEDRLAMMQLFEETLPSDITVDIGITKHARFMDKSIAVAEHYGTLANEQVYLTGFDTLVRILDGKYYPPTHRLDVLDSFFNGGNKIRCMMREGAWGEKEMQKGYLKAIADGEREAEGCKREWAESIEMVENPLGPLSSTVAREAAKIGDTEALDKLLPEYVKWWILEKKLYTEQAHEMDR